MRQYLNNGYGELRIDPPRQETGRDKLGRWTKGHTTHNKGKKWDEYISKRGQRRCQRGWKNIIEHRGHRPDNAGRPRRQVIAVLDDGSWRFFKDILTAALFCGGQRTNVRRCCEQNAKHHHDVRNGAVNTDHKYMGVRFYYESDDTWTNKISQ